MNNELNSILDQISKLKKPANNPDDVTAKKTEESLSDVMSNLLQEIRRVLIQNNLSQDDLCKITNMSQSNISKIQHGKVIPRLDTLQKIAMATNTRLVISFEPIEGDE